MRKLTVGLVVVGLLAVAAPAMAQQADPLGLIATGAVLPYVGAGSISPGSFSVLEVAAPVGGQDVHLFFYDVNCVKGQQSVGQPLTEKEVAVIRVDNIAGNPPDGLIALAEASADGFSLIGLTEPLHARVLWINGSQAFIRVLEPISAANWDLQFRLSSATEGSGVTWNPLRTAATFWAPPEIPGILSTTIYFICPTADIFGRTKSSAFPDWRSTATTTTPATFSYLPFPRLNPDPVPSGASTPLRDGSSTTGRTSGAT